MDNEQHITVDEDSIARMMFGKNVETIKRAADSFFELFGIIESSKKKN